MKKIYVITETVNEQICILAEGFKTKKAAIKEKEQLENVSEFPTIYNVHEIEVQ